MMAKSKEKRRIFTREQKEEHVRNAGEYQEGITAYCIKHRISSGQFYGWRAELNGRPPRSRVKPAFLPVVLEAPEGSAPATQAPPAEEGAGIVLLTNQGHRIILAKNFDAEALKRLLGIIG